MYQRYCSLQGWKTEIMSLSESDLGGYKDATLEVHGARRLCQAEIRERRPPRPARARHRDPGPHPYQRRHRGSAAGSRGCGYRDPADKDLRIDTYRAQGAGGQHVNKTDSAVRITHIPTNTVVAMQEEKSQHKNKAKAMTLLKAKIYDAERKRVDSARASERKKPGRQRRSQRAHPDLQFPARPGHRSPHQPDALQSGADHHRVTNWARSSTPWWRRTRPTAWPLSRRKLERHGPRSRQKTGRRRNRQRPAGCAASVGRGAVARSATRNGPVDHFERRTPRAQASGRVKAGSVAEEAEAAQIFESLIQRRLAREIRCRHHRPQRVLEPGPGGRTRAY